MNYYQIHKNKKPNRKKRKGYVRGDIPLMCITAEMGASQIALISNEVFPDYNGNIIDRDLAKLKKENKIFESILNTLKAITVDIPKSEMLNRFKQTKRYIK